MSGTEFFSPTTLEEAFELLDKYRERAVIVNGGTDIVEKIADGTVDPDAIIYIQPISELKGIRETKGFIHIGGAATYKDILSSALCSQFSALEQAVWEVGSPPIRVLGTPAGNLGTAVPAADCNVALMALGAEVLLASSAGDRTLKLTDLFVGNGQTALKNNELIKEIRIPITGVNAASAFVKLARRKAQDIAQLSVAVSLTVEGDTCREICIALGAVNSVIVRAYSLEKLMNGNAIDAGIAAVKKTIPEELSLRNPRNKPYKEAVIGVAVERAIKKAYAEVMGREK